MGEGHAGWAKLFLGTVAACALAAGLAAPAHAGSGPSHVVPLLGTAPTIDGVFGTFEWSQATSYPATFGPFSGTVYVGRTATDLYIGLAVSDPGGAAGDSDVFFDNNDNGAIDVGEDLIALNHGEAGTNWYSINNSWSTTVDTSGGGTNDVTAAESYSGGLAYVEYRHPLCSTDTAHDFCFVPPATESSPPSKLGYTVGYSNPDRSSIGFDPAGIVSIGQYGNLVIPPPDTTPPTVTLDAPSAGFVGPSTDFAATAADTGSGVDHVAFEYSATGDGGWAALGTATAPAGDGKWHALWSSRPADGHYFVRAHAYDKLGNEAATNAIEVTLDATPPTLTVSCRRAGTGSEHACKWFTSEADLPVGLDSSMADTGSGLATAYATTDGSDPLSSPTATRFDNGLQFTVSTYLRVGVRDNVGNASYALADIGVDTTPPPSPHVHLVSAAEGHPTSSGSATGTGLIAWYNPTVDGSFTLSVPLHDDPESGIASVSFGSFEATGWTTPPRVTPYEQTYTWTTGAAPPASIDVKTTNGAGVASPVASVGFSPDQSQPAGFISCVPDSCHSTDGPVHVTVTASDGNQSGVDELRYTTDGSDPSADNGTVIQPGDSFDVSAPGTQVKVWGVDAVGNEGMIATASVSGAPLPGTPIHVSPFAGDPPYDTGFVVQQGVPISITATGSVNCGAEGCDSGPEGRTNVSGEGALLPDAPPMSLIARIGASGPWVFIGAGPTQISGSGELFLAVNDGYFPDNSGPGFDAVIELPDPVQSGPTFTVSTADDHADSAGCTVADCTLREAIDAANQFDGAATVAFAIPGPTPTIHLQSALPWIAGGITVDARTQLGAIGAAVVLDGRAVEGDGLVLNGDNSVVAGFDVQGFFGIGILVLGSHDQVLDNYLGLDQSGFERAGNSGDGVRLTNGDGNVVTGNFVGGNGGHGIFLIDETHTIVQSNKSGTDAGGLTAIPNGVDGIAVDGGSNNSIGGPGILGNIASGNTNQGISLFGGFNTETPTTSGNVVYGNRVGVGSTGLPIPNGGDGIRMFDGFDNTIGGVGEGQANTVAHNGGAGVAVVHDDSTGNSIRGNTIFGNGGLGIDLGSDGVTANDPGDADTGPNDLQNFPVLAPPVRSGSTVTVAGKLVAAPDTRYVVDAYMNTTCHSSGFGEGEAWSGSADVTTDGNGEAAVAISFNLAQGATANAVTLTATDATRHETSEFSQCQAVSTVGATTDASVTLSADASSAEAGASVITLANIPRSAFMPPPPPAAPIESSPIESSPIESSPIESSPIESSPIESSPIESSPIESSPIESSPIESSGLTPANLRQNALGGVPLSQLPLKAPLTWAQVLGTPVVEQATTLADALALSPRPAGLAALDVGDIDWAHAGTALASLGVGAFAFGSVQLSDIGLGGVAAGAPARAAWCHAIDVLQGFHCSDPATLNNTTVMDIALEGIPIESSGLGAAPIESSNLAQAPIESSPIESSTLAGTPIESSPLDGVDLNVSVLGGIPLSAVLATSSPLRGIAAAALPGGVLTCFACATTLGAAFDAGHVAPAATVRDLGAALHGFTIGDLRTYPGVTVGNIGPGLPASLDLRDLLRALFAHIPFNPDTMPLDGIQDVADSGGLVTYTAQLTLTGVGAPTLAQLHAALAPGARYVPGTTKLTRNGVSAPYGDPGVLDGGLAWQLSGLAYGATYQLSFQVRPSLQLGRDTTQVTLVPVGATAKTSNAVPVTVTDTFEGGAGNNTPATAKAIDAGKAYLSFQQTPADQDWYSLPVPPTGTLTTISLSHLGNDKDLVVFAPSAAPLRSAPIESSPIESSPIESSPVPDVKPTLQQATSALQPVAVQDVPIESSQLGSKTIAGVSDNTGTSNESVSVVATGAQQGGSYLIHVVDSDPTPTSTPYMLRAAEESPPPLPPCTPRPAFAKAGQGQPGVLPAFAGVPVTTKTIVLVDYKRYGDTFGTLAENALKSELAAFVARPEVLGVVLPVEGSPAVQAAYNTWDANPCAPENANGVVRAIISTVIDPFRSTHPNVKFLVIGGSDDIVPFPRVVDNTVQANEASYRSVLGTVNGLQVNNQLVGTAASAYMQTDDVWSAFNPTPFLGGQLYLPQWATGRLVETPAQIDHQLATYNATGGAINATTELSVGYGFLADSAAATAQAVSPFAPGGPGNLISDSWTRSDLLGKLQLGQPSPAIVALNTHFDHHRALPAAGGQLFDSSEVNPSPSVLQTNSELGRLIFSVGCHSGLSVPDFLYAWPFSLDWPEADLSAGAVARIGNTTFGYGDTDVIGYSEAVEVDFAQRLSQMTLGEALLYAKQQYFADLGVFGPYEQKATNALTFYGLPMQHIGSPVTQTAPPPQATTTDAATGLVALPIDSQVTFAAPVQTADGEYFTGPDGVDATSNRPFEPKRILPDITEPGTMPHGFLITDLGIAAQYAHVRIARSTPIPDSANLTPPLSSEVGYPSSLARVSSFASPTGPRQQLVLTHGQFLSDAGADTTGLGTQTNFGRIKGLVLYSPSKDAFPVQLTNPRVTRIGNTLGIEVDATDTTDTSGTPGVVKEVVAVYLEPGATTSHTVYLTQTPGTNHWSGGGPLTSPSTTEVSYIIQGVDASGNVGRTVHKVAAASVNIAPQGGGGGGSIGFSVSGPSAGGGWYGGTVTVTVTAPAGDAVSVGVNGSALRPYTAPFTVSGDGLHLVDATAQNADGSTLTGQTAVPIDVGAPTATINTPHDGAILFIGDKYNADYTCSDGGSGIAATAGCTGTIANGSPIPTLRLPGTYTFRVNATDVVGHTGGATSTYRLVPFLGFLPPVDNAPKVNDAKAGSAVPLKFSLLGNLGLNLFDPGYPASQQVSCTTGAPLDGNVQTATAGDSGLQYESGSTVYTYVWKTDKAWAGTCRQVILKFRYGSMRKALFKFR